MPIRIKVSLSATNKIPNLLGDDVHALFFKLLDKETANTLHSGYKEKPFSLWFKTSENLLTLYISFLQDELARIFIRSYLLGEELLEFMNIKFKKNLNLKIEAKDIRSYEKIYKDAPLRTVVKLKFITPTTFKKGKYDYPVPEPELIFRSLMRKWNKFADYKPGIDLREAFREKIIISSYELRTKKVYFRNLGKAVGFLGDIILEFHEKDETILKWLNALLNFGEFCGVGRKTTMGMGRTEILS
ncbi:CRISPR-associated endoribonuclease Cas6 [Aquifex sp.]